MATLQEKKVKILSTQYCPFCSNSQNCVGRLELLVQQRYETLIFIIMVSFYLNTPVFGLQNRSEGKEVCQGNKQIVPATRPVLKYQINCPRPA